MNGQTSSPVLDGRDAAAVPHVLLARLPGYVPGWQPSKSGPSSALTQVFARYLQALIERLDQAPAKNELAFLDMLGINLLSAQAARAPVVFKAQPGAGNGRVPARSQVGAKVEGRSTPLVFETDSDIALAAGPSPCSSRSGRCLTSCISPTTCTSHSRARPRSICNSSSRAPAPSSWTSGGSTGTERCGAGSRTSPIQSRRARATASTAPSD